MARIEKRISVMTWSMAAVLGRLADRSAWADNAGSLCSCVRYLCSHAVRLSRASHAAESTVGAVDRN
jgi:hypothetical protein